MNEPNLPTDEFTRRSDRGAGARWFFALLRRRGWIVIACLVVLPGAIYLYSARQAKVYQSHLIVQPGSTTPVAHLSSTDVLSQRLNPDAGIVQAWSESPQVAARTAALTHRAAGAGGLGSTVQPGTSWVILTATGPDPAVSQRAVSAFQRALDDVLVSLARDARSQLISGIKQNLKIAPSESLLASYRTLTTTQPPRHILQVVQPATGAVVVSPHPRRNATLAAILAVLIAAGLIVLVERLDRRVRRPEDLEALAEMPVLCTIPSGAFRDGAHPEETVAAFATLRDLLSNAHSSVRSLVVVSPLKEEGKTTVAAGLAMAFAAAGRRVILVDADLRNGRLASRMGVPATPGLSDVLASGGPDSALQEVEWTPGDLRLLPAGSASHSPAELLGSDRMVSVLEGLAAESDLVVIDTPALLAVSDALPMLRRASGVLGVARLNETPRRAVRRMARIAAPVGPRFLGIVATGAAAQAWGALDKRGPHALEQRNPSPVI